MQIEPSPSAFAEIHARGQSQVVWTTLVADLETPVSAFLKVASGKPMSFLLESVEGGAVRGRYSVIGLEPDVVWRTLGATAEINRAPRSSSKASAFEPCREPPLAALRSLIAESRIELPDSLPPMAAGVFGYLGYDMVRLMEELPATHPDPIGIADAILVRPTIGVSAEAALARAVERLTSVVDALDQPLAKDAGGTVDGPLAATASNTTPAEYATMVRKAKDYIAAGDIFQVVLAQRFSAPFALPPFSLYRALRRVNPAPFLFFLDFGDFAVAGSSPEILVRLRG